MAVNALLKSIHISSKKSVVSDSRRILIREGQTLPVTLSESENVVNEQQHTLTFLITKCSAVARDGQKRRHWAQAHFSHYVQATWVVGRSFSLSMQ
jgi:hypothetical protein